MARVAKITKKTESVASAVLESAPKRRSTMPVVVVLVVLLMIAIGIAGYFYYQYRNAQPGVAEAKEISDLTRTIGAFMELPENEVPTLATVTNKEKLAEQPFFQKAENGDKVLIFSQNGRAILYRPSQKKIVDVTTVNVNQPAPAPETAPATEPTTPPVAPAVVPSIVRVALYNGSTIVGITNKVEAQLKQVSDTLSVVTKETAKKNDYPETLVVDMTGKNATLAEEVARTLKGVVGTIPSTETVPADVDMLVIVGKE